MDMESEIIICALRRLSGQVAVRTVSTPLDRQPSEISRSSLLLSNDMAAEQLRRDSDAYILSLLLRPDGLEGYSARLHPALVPSSSRAWTAACYLYLHLILWRGKEQEPIDTHFWRWLLATLRDDVDAAAEAVRLAQACPDRYVWTLVVCLYGAQRATATVDVSISASHSPSPAATNDSHSPYATTLPPAVLDHDDYVADWLPWARTRFGEWKRQHCQRRCCCHADNPELRLSTAAPDWLWLKGVLNRTAWPQHTGLQNGLETRETVGGLIEGEDELRAVWLQAAVSEQAEQLQVPASCGRQAWESSSAGMGLGGIFHEASRTGE